MTIQSTLNLPGLTVPATGSAVLSTCRRYRYELWRRWDDGPYCCFIGLNPSTADETVNDPTIRKCTKFAQRWKYGALCMVNLFAYRATFPSHMKRVLDPVGPENDLHLANCARFAGLVVGAWGVDGDHLRRSMGVRALLSGCNLHHLGLTKRGEPKHPLYLLDATVPTPLNH